MTADLAKIDPQSAWSPYVPDGQRPWNQARAAHLYRRAGFAGTTRQLQEATQVPPREVVKRLFGGESESAALRAEIEALAQAILATGDPKQLSAAWVYRLLYTPDPLREKMTLFWHGHFATSAEKVEDAALMWEQNELLRRHALGDFAAMTNEIARDPAMLIYLDSATNRRAHPNENFARELMELFCLGEGNYTEKDIQELARCFTGWEVQRRKYRFNRFQFDSGDKTILGQKGKFTGEDGVRVVLDQPAMPLFIVGKLFRFFVMDEPQPPAALLEPLARQFRDERLQLAPLVERMLGSQLFFSDEVVGRKIRSPVELGVGVLRALEGSSNTVDLANELLQVGQGLFYPPNVKGWDGGRAWVNSSTLLGRANLVRRVLTHEKSRFAGGSLGEFAQRHGLTSPEPMLDWIQRTLLAVPLSGDVRTRLLTLGARTDGGVEAQFRELLCGLATLPEFQLA